MVVVAGHFFLPQHTQQFVIAGVHMSKKLDVIKSVYLVTTAAWVMYISQPVNDGRRMVMT